MFKQTKKYFFLKFGFKIIILFVMAWSFFYAYNLNDPIRVSYLLAWTLSISTFLMIGIGLLFYDSK